MPKFIRTDNGEPFGVPTRDIVPIMSLWLKAWGIPPILNRPRTPTDNAKVERGQGTTSRWAELSLCPNLEFLQHNLDEACRMQREKFPVLRLGNVTRADLHQSLREVPRPFDSTKFNPRHAYDFLAEAKLPRKVCSSGTITLYGKAFTVGAKLKRQVMMIHFDADQLAWIVTEQNGTVCKTLPDERFSPIRLFNLTCQRTSLDS